MKEQKKQPELRFKGFTDDWEQRDLGKLTDVYDGTHQTPKYLDKGIMFISVENIDTLESQKFISVDEFNREFKVYPEVGDVLMTRIGDVGTTNVVRSTRPIAYYVSLALLKKKNMPATFLSFGIQSPNIQKEIWRRTLHVAFPKKINKIEIEKIPFFKTRTEEEIKIGDFFENLNYIVNLQQRKLELLKKLKRGYLQQMFPVKDMYIPQLRFNEFNGDWKQCKLGEIFTERTERSGEGELISVTINSGVVKASELDRKDNSSKNKSNYKKVEIGDIAYNSMRMWQGASGYSPYKGILSPAYTVITPKSEVDSEFFAYDFKRFNMIQTFKRNSQGLTSDTWNLKFPTLKSIKLMVPFFDEQIKISSFFNQIDNMILLQQSKIGQLNKIKQAYLQKLFP